MADKDRLTQRGGEREGSRAPSEEERAGAFRGQQDVRREQRGGGAGGRSEFGGYGAPTGPGGGQGGGGHGPGYGGGQGGSGYGGAGRSGGAGYGGSGGQGPGGHGAAGRGGGERGVPRPAWDDDTWSDRERWESGGGTGGSGPSGLGWQTDAGYGAGATGYGRSGSGALGDWSARSGAIGGGATGPMRNRGPKGWQRSDERIHDDVCERLAAEPGIDPSEVTVEVRDGTVQLGGSVPDRGMKYRIEDIVDGCSGVRDVENRLRVSRGGLGGMFGGAAMGLGTTTDARDRSGRPADEPGRPDPSGDAGGSRGSLLGRLFGFSTGAKLADIMTRNPRTVAPDDTLQKAAQAMKDQDVGAIPVCSGRTVAGMLTDRDIVVRAVAGGKVLEQTRVSEVMTTQVHTCYEDEDVESALDKMGDLQVRRIPVVDRSNQLVGIVSLGDFAQRDAGDVDDALQDISAPT